MAKHGVNENRSTEEEVDGMALAQRMNSGFIVSQGKEGAFFKKMNDNRPTKEFWAECERLRGNVSQKAVDEMNALMDRED